MSAKPFKRRIASERLILCPMTARHKRAVVAALSDYEVAKFLGSVAHPYPPEDFDRFLARVKVSTAKGRTHHYAIEDVRGRFVGSITLFRRGREGWELGYYITPRQSGRGYVTEAARTLIAHAFHGLGFRRLQAGHHIDNPASGRVLQKLGFARTHRQMRPCLARKRKIMCNELVLTRAAFRKAMQ